MTRVIELKQAPDFFGRVLAGEMKQAALRGLYSAAVRSVQLLQTQEIQRASPAPVDRGVYRAGWRAEKLIDGAAVVNSVPWAAMIEYGVPGRNVTIGRQAVLALAEWARRRLGVSSDKALSTAWAILIAGKRRGLFRRGEGLRILETYARERMPQTIREEIARALDAM